MKRIVCFGEMLLRLGSPGREPLLRSPALEAGFGGAEANVALSLAGFGLDAAIITALPDNAIGEACLGELRRHRVDAAGVIRRPGRMGLYFVTRGAMVRPAQIVYDRAHSAFAEADSMHYDWRALLRGADWLHISGISLALGPPVTRAVASAIEVADELGIAISFDCNYRPSLWRGREHDAASQLRSVAERSRLLFGGVLDASMLFDADCSTAPRADAFARAAEAVLAACPRLRHVAGTDRVVHSADHHELTGLLADGDGTSASRTHALNPIVDRIGSGDAFAAGVLYGLCTGLDRQQTVEFATASAALKHSVPGDFNVVAANEVRELMQDSASDARR